MRCADIATPDVEIHAGPDGALYFKDRRSPGEWPPQLTAWLDHWAIHAPDRPFLVERDPAGAWASIAYGGVQRRVRALAQALVDRGLSADRPLVILSGNSVQHALLALAAMYAGVLYAPVSPAYSLQSRDLGILKAILSMLPPGLVFASDESAYARALGVIGPGVEIATGATFDDLALTAPSPAVDQAHAAVGPGTIAKILFTSGSTGHPKGVINTHRMLCSNQAMLRAVFPFLAEEPPILCDWLPWHHTAGGNHNFGIVLANGGTMYIDGGRPTPDGIETTVRNLRDVAATAHFTVPRTYEALLPYLKNDTALRSMFFSRLRLFFYAAAGLSQRYFDELQALAVETTGREILWVTGLGSTETAPMAICTGNLGAFSGFVGFPVPGVELKLAPVGQKLEACVRGPNITPGYWGHVSATSAAFDDEGFYRMGDALRPVDPDDLTKGLLFDGRLTEDFKLSSGTWVSVGPLRARLLLHFGPYVQDVVIAAPDRAFVAALVFPNLGACRGLCRDISPAAPASSVIAHPRVREKFAALLTDLARQGTGSSTSVARAILVDAAPSIDLGEVTDKGSLNQKAILRNRTALVEELYAQPASIRTIAV
jgi:feruloyl-CoA synthase